MRECITAERKGHINLLSIEPTVRIPVTRACFSHLRSIQSLSRLLGIHSVARVPIGMLLFSSSICLDRAHVSQNLVGRLVYLAAFSIDGEERE